VRHWRQYSISHLISFFFRWVLCSRKMGKQVKSDARFISTTIYKRLADVVFYFKFHLLLFKMN
jgi:hypothetical protein